MREGRESEAYDGRRERERKKLTGEREEAFRRIKDKKQNNEFYRYQKQKAKTKKKIIKMCEL